MTKVIHTKTHEEFKQVLEIFDKKGWVWYSGNKPLKKIFYWNFYKEKTCIDYEDNFEYAFKEWYEEKGWEVISFEEFLRLEGFKMKKVIHTKTKKEFKKVLEIFEKKGWTWRGGRKPLKGIFNWYLYKEKTCIDYEDNFEYAFKEWYEEKGWEVISFEEFLELEIIKLSEEQIRQEMILNWKWQE